MGRINCKYSVTINGHIEHKYNCNTAMKIACYSLWIFYCFFFIFMQSYPCGFNWGSQRRVNALSHRWDLASSGRSKLWEWCDSPANSSMCGGPNNFSSTEVGRIVPPRDFIRECVYKCNQGYHWLYTSICCRATISVNFSSLC